MASIRITVTLALVLAVAALGCDPALAPNNTLGMGDECADSAQCMGEGTCLKGICSGYACEKDVDCDDDLVCGEVAGMGVCVTECDDSADCGGDQTCTTVEQTTAEDAPTADYCF
jgi:hypothetical protein